MACRLNAICVGAIAAPGADGADDLRANAVDADVHRREQERCQPLLLMHQSEEDVLTADAIVLERPRFVVLTSPLAENFSPDSTSTLSGRVQA